MDGGGGGEEAAANGKASNRDANTVSTPRVAHEIIGFDILKSSTKR
jgi:hypothetical protein